MSENYKLIINIFILLLLNARARVVAINFVPAVTNFSSVQYNSSLQNWDVTQDDNGTIYIGNNSGLLVFDGYTWQKYVVPGNAVVRSVLCDGSRVYVGSAQEFGFMQRDNTGTFRYHSLWKLVKGYSPHNDEIWRILKTDDGRILFQSFSSWFEYDGRKVKAHFDPNHIPLFFYKAGRDIYVQIINDGFCKLKNGKYIPVVDRKALGNDDVMGVVALGGNRMLLCTGSHGMFLFDGNSLRPFHTDADALLKSGQINRVVTLRYGNGMVVGTVNNGVIGFDYGGHMLWHYNTTNMLDNNTVLGLYCDRQDNIWVVCDIGIALIHSGSPYSVLGDNHHPLGMVYDIMNTPSGMYIATNLCTFLYHNGLLTRVSGTEGQNWHLTMFGRQIVVGSNHNIMSINGLSAQILPGSGTASSTAVRRLSLNDRGTEEYILESTYTDLRVYHDIGGHLTFRNAVRDFQAPVRQFEIDRHGTVWAANMTKGFYRVTLSGDLRRATSVKYFPTLDSTKVACPINITKLDGNIILADGKHVCRLTDRSKLKRDKALESLTHGDIISITRVDGERAWIASRRGYMLISNKDGHLRSLLTIPASFFNSVCSDNTNRVYVDGSYAYLCMNDMVARVDMRQPHDRASKKWKLWIRKVESTDASSNNTILLPVDGAEALMHGNVNITLGYANYNHAQLSFVYSLKGGGREIKGLRDVPVLGFSDLSYGKYRLHVDVADVNGRILGSLEYKFQYPKPWYLSWWASALYLIALLMAVYGAMKWYARYALNKRQAQMESERIRQDLRIAEQNRIIEEQKKLLLEEQLKDQGKEIADLTMTGIRQKQQMKEITEEIGKDPKKLSKQSIKTMLSHITNDIDTDTYWDIYSKNFDLIHKNFFRNLRKLNPSLTATDMKFCALLRLNLSTKEIAQFTGLTLRGVEGARYRLRKKLDIPKDMSLTQFLLDI